jgi:hypothetical protein
MGVDSKGKSRGANGEKKKRKKGGRKNTVVMFHKLVGGPLPEERMESLLWNLNYSQRENEKMSEPATNEREEGGKIKRGGVGWGSGSGSHQMSKETQVFSDILSKRITVPLPCDPNWKFNAEALKSVTHSTASFAKISVNTFPLLPTSLSVLQQKAKRMIVFGRPTNPPQVIRIPCLSSLTFLTCTALPSLG